LSFSRPKEKDQSDLTSNRKKSKREEKKKKEKGRKEKEKNDAMMTIKGWEQAGKCVWK